MLEPGNGKTVSAGSEIGHYRVVGLVGQGGMAVVYLAEPIEGGDPVALKLLSPDLGRDEEFRRRFLRESRYAASLDHPNVIPVKDAGEVDDSLYIAMHYVRGTDLKTLLTVEGALAPERAIALLSQVAEALDAVHAGGLLHRDVKPGNVIVASGEGRERPDHCYLTDFGLSKRPSQDSGALTAAGDFVGTYHYTAPEQILGRDVDSRGDVYSLGCVLYECLTGEAPFHRETAEAVLHAHIEEPPPKAAERGAGVTQGLDEVIAKAMAKDAADRYGSCVEMMDAAAAAAGVPGAERHTLRLKVTAGNAVGTVIEIVRELSIGRQAEGDGTLADDVEISRRHARIAAGADGRFRIDDLGSTNGTFVNGARVEGTAVLEKGDTIEVGATTLMVLDAPEAPGPGDGAGLTSDALGPADAARPSPGASLAGGGAHAGISLRFELDVQAGEARLQLDEHGDEVTLFLRDGRWRLR